MTTATATGQEKYRKPYSPITPGFEYAEINNIGSVKEKITPHTAAVMLEFIQGESGVNVCTAEFIEMCIRDRVWTDWWMRELLRILLKGRAMPED